MGYEKGEFDPLAYLNSLQTLHEPDGIRHELFQCLEKVLGTLRNLLDHSTEDNDFQDPEQVREVLMLDTRGGFSKYEQLLSEINRRGFQLACPGEEQITQDPRVKITVVCKAMSNFRAHLGAIEEMIAKYIVL